MHVKIKALIIPLLILYLVFAAKLSFAVANTILVITLGIIAFKIFSKKAKREYLFFNGIKSVPKEFVFNDNTLSNHHCIVRYFQNEKIIVMDNPVSKVQEFLRAFVVNNTNNENVDDCWREICSVFDGYTYLDSLFSFIDKASGRLSMIFLTSEEDKYSVDGMEEFLPKIPKKEPPIRKPKNEKLSQKIANPDDKGAILVDFEDLKKQNITVKEKEKPEDVVDMQDLTDSDKINVNFANIQTISELPGINIVMAKKIVEYRNINGFFKSKDEFLDIAGVKSHFRGKISKIITVKKSSFTAPNVIKIQTERTVD
jgi:DNA uptake protein ComE-like DNA-binding protein